MSDIPSQCYISLFLVTYPDSITINVTFTSAGFSLMLSLSNYIQNGTYHIITKVTWMRFVHSCSDGVGRSYLMDHAYTINPMEVTIEELLPNSEYNIAVEVTNAVGSKTKSVTDMTSQAGEALKPKLTHF